jgi:hypothetical protein
LRPRCPPRGRPRSASEPRPSPARPLAQGRALFVLETGMRRAWHLLCKPRASAVDAVGGCESDLERAVETVEMVARNGPKRSPIRSTVHTAALALSLVGSETEGEQ